MRKVTILFIFNLLFLACMDTHHYQYADGNGNVYILNSSTLEYIPVKPEESSSGFYSGGEAKTVSVSTEQFSALQSLFEKGMNNSAVQINERIKMSGVITHFRGDQQNKYILKPGSAELVAIESRLNEIISK